MCYKIVLYKPSALALGETSRSIPTELGQLKYFVTIADTQSFTKAAKILHLSQPALSYQIRRLETELGIRLFDRGNRKLTCTTDGKLFLPLAQAVLFRADEAVRILREHLGVEAGKVRAGARDSVVTYFLPQILASFRRNFPRVLVELSEGADAELEHGVLDGTIDFAIVAAASTLPTIETTRLLTEDLLLVLPTSHRFANRSSVGLRELAYEQFVMPARAANLVAHLVDASRFAGFEPKISHQTGSIETVKSFVRHGLGAAVLPRITIGTPSGSEALIAIPLEEQLTRSLMLIRAKDRSMPAAAQALMTHVRDSLIRCGNGTPSAPAGVGKI
jgi:DNA-binding transcriptional LysR family regulator